jgi:hypothetical protein
MKTYILALTAIVLSMHFKTAFGQTFESPAALNNKALAVSPRAREAFPWLARQAHKSALPEQAVPLAQATKTRAWAASPRTLEQFPELLRPQQPPRNGIDLFGLSGVTKNRAWATSPRGLEESPWLSRGGIGENSAQRIEVAPLR